ncbi:MAG: uracil phosphoribosyltransferase [Planctomycetota bacterium]|nr:MAG: uracil phosphoribosyltransferase [Planctomycetota bacterium]
MPQPKVSASTHPLVRHKLTRLRSTRTDSRSFRALVSEIATLLAYEATRDLPVEDIEVQTPLTTTRGCDIDQRIGLVPILRAGLGMVDGVERVLPQAQVWHLGLYRDERTLQPVQYYNKLPADPTVDLCLLLDPMLATGNSAIAATDVLKDWGVARVAFLGILASPEGLAAYHSAHPDVAIHVAGIDERLTTESDGVPAGYIWPGLGDAGDRQFGTESPAVVPAPRKADTRENDASA